MLPWLCASPSIPLSFNLAVVLPRRSASCVSFDPPRKQGKASGHSLRLGLQGSLIPFAPLAVVPQRQDLLSHPPSPSEFLSISTDFTPTPTVPVTPTTFNSSSIVPHSPVKREALKNNLLERLRNTLHPINPGNAHT